MSRPRRLAAPLLAALLLLALPHFAAVAEANHSGSEYRLPVSRGTIVKHPIGGGEAQWSEHRPTSPVMNIVVVPPPPIPNSAQTAMYMAAVMDSLADLSTAGTQYGNWFQLRITWDYQILSENLSPLTAFDIEILIVADPTKGPSQWVDTRQTNRLAHEAGFVTGSPCIIDNSMMFTAAWTADQMYNANIAAIGRCLGLDGENLHPEMDAFAANVFGDRIPPSGLPSLANPPAGRRCPSNLDVRGMEAAFSTSIPSVPDFHVAVVPVASYQVLSC